MRFTTSLLALVGAASLVSASPIAAEVAVPEVHKRGDADCCEVMKHMLYYEYFLSGSGWDNSQATLKQAVRNCGVITGWQYEGAYHLIRHPNVL